MGRKIGNILLTLLLTGGIVMACYPAVSNWLLERFAFSVIGNYQESVDQMSDDEIQKKKEAARKYNATLPNGGDYVAYGDEGESTMDILNVGEIVGYLEIPSIEINLPVYEGTSDAVLQKGVGHLKNTSLPIGGAGTHAGLSAHRGLPSAKLFSDLDEVEVGALFYLTVLDETLAYKVDQIKITEPYISNELDIEEHKDYVTLITCTPFGINSHRLLVRGVRTDYRPAVAQQLDEAVVLEKVPKRYVLICRIGCIMEILLVEVLIIIRRLRKNDKQQKGSESWRDFIRS